jgi:cobalamin-dependent methionine synthase I
MADRKAKVIALCQSEDAMAETADDKVKLVEKLVEKISAAGIPLDDLYIDPLVYPLSTNVQYGIDHGLSGGETGIVFRLDGGP